MYMTAFMFMLFEYVVAASGLSGSPAKIEAPHPPAAGGGDAEGGGEGGVEGDMDGGGEG